MVLETNKGEWTWEVEFGTRKKSSQLAKHARLYSDLLQALKGGYFSALGSQPEGPRVLCPHYPTASSTAQIIY